MTLAVPARAEGDRFLWHPRARVLAGGAAVVPDAVGGGGVLDAGAGGSALAGAFCGPFRIGGAERLEAGPGCFETLTSGSSGQPRRILRSVRSWQLSFAVNGRLFGLGPGARVAVPGGLTHSLSLYAALEGVHLGAEVALLGGLRPDRQRQAIAAAAASHLYATPAQCRSLAEVPGPVLGDLRWVILGGSKLDAGLRGQLAVLAPGAQVVEFYGAAETSFITLSDATTPAASVGRAYPGVQIEIRAAGRVLDEGQTGEVWTRSPYGFLRYGGAEPGSARQEGGWISVGEMGRLEGGCLFLAGRAGRVVQVADQNVFPEEIETFLAGLPGVRRCAILARPDPLRGHVLIAVIQGERAEEAALLRALRAQLGPMKAPRQVIWRQDWPVLGSGKTDLRRLEAEA